MIHVISYASDWIDLSFVEYHVVNPVVDAGGHADISLRIQVTGNGAADLQPEARLDTDAYQISAFLAKDRSLALPTMKKQVFNEVFSIFHVATSNSSTTGNRGFFYVKFTITLCDTSM